MGRQDKDKVGPDRAKKWDRYDGWENGNKRGDGASRTVRSHAEFFFTWLIGLGWRMENWWLSLACCFFFWFTLHYFLWLAGEESREYTIRLAFLAFLFFVGLRFSVSSWLYTQTSFYFLFIYFFNILYIYFFFALLSFLVLVLLLLHGSGQIIVVNSM